MPENNKDLPVQALKACEKCGNPFLVKKSKELTEFICDNCIKLDQRKRELQVGVLKNAIEVENQMENSIKEMTNTLTLSRGKFNKEFYLEKIKKKAETLWKSIELIEKIEDSKEEKYVDEYRRFFEKLKKQGSS